MSIQKWMIRLWIAGVVACLLLLSSLPASHASPLPNPTTGRLADLVVGVPYEHISTTADAGYINILHGLPGGVSGYPSQAYDRNNVNIFGDSTEDDLFAAALATGDFNGDYYYDLALGMPAELPSTSPGGVVIMFGTLSGIVSTGSQWFEQGTAGDAISGEGEANDRFGAALATGDFNNDGYDDLVIGVPNEDIDGDSDAGGINVLYGSAGGLSATANQWFDQDTTGVPDDTSSNEQFGAALAVADFDGDGFDDVAIGAPGELVMSGEDPNIEAGAVCILFGSSGGLTTTGSQWFDQASGGIASNPKAYENFAYALAGGDIDGDGYAELVIGVPGEFVDTLDAAGGVHVLYGTDGGLSTTVSQHFTLNNLSYISQASDRFGYSLAVDDFNNDGFMDMAVGSPFRDNNLTINSGEIFILYGSVHGITLDGKLRLFDVMYMDNNQFGYALAAGDLNGDGYADLAIGIPGRDVNALIAAGEVMIIFSSPSGFEYDTRQRVNQDSPGVMGGPEAGDKFGLVLAIFPTRYCAYLPLLVR